MWSRMYADGARRTHGISRRRPCHSRSNRHMKLGSQANPLSAHSTRRSGNRSNAPSATRLMICVWKALGMSTYSSRYVLGQPTDVGGSPLAPPKCRLRTSPWRVTTSKSGHQIRLPYGANERTGSTTWTKPGIFGAAFDLLDRQRRVKPRHDDRPVQARLVRSSHCSASQELAALLSAAAASGFLIASVA